MKLFDPSDYFSSALVANPLDPEFRARLGQCYILSGRYVMKHHDAVLVHGSIQGFGNPRIRHAWVELADGRVHDAVLGQTFAASIHKQVFNTQVEHKYTHERLLAMLLRTRNWGPWTDEERTAPDLPPARSRRRKSNPVGDPLPPKVVAAFVALGHAQRGAPETAMGVAQEALGGGGMSFIIEHTGDLTHRMTHMLAWTRPSAGYGYVAEKVDKVLYTLRHRYGFGREHAENMRRNADYRKVEFAQHMARANAALEAYAQAHRKLPVYNRAQWLARESAVALGYNGYHAAEKHLTELEKMLDTEESWWEAATAYTLDTRGEPVLYCP